jgi:hypothetical protein
MQKTWDKPTTPVEALTIALEMAREEAAWTAGNWFQFPIFQDHERYEQAKAEGDDFVPEVCTDVKACAAGILLIALGNGPVLQQAFRTGAVPVSGLLYDDEVGSSAAAFLAKGFIEQSDTPRLFGEPSVVRPGAAIDVITGLNDGAFRYAHDKIVAGFERALELAQEAEGVTA